MWNQVTNSILLGLVGMSGQALAQRCAVPFAEVISIEGRVEILVSSPGIQTVSTLDNNAALCIGDAIRTGPRSEALLRIFEGDGQARIEANSTVEFTDEGTGGRPLLDLRGIIYFFLRLPSPLDIRTQFVTAGVEGTQFVVDGDDERTRLSVLEGLLRVTNLGDPTDQLLLAAGDVAEGRANQPLQRIQVDARDAVAWAIYYQPTSYAFLDADPALFADSRDALLGGDLDGAITALDAIPEADRDERFYVYRAGLLLTSGDLAEAETDLATAEQLAPESGEPHGLRAIIAVAANDREAALESGRRATELSPDSPSAWVARSYAEQADTELEAARDALLAAVTLDPDDRLAQARLSELWLSLGYVDRAVAAAEQAIDIPEGPAPRAAELGRAYTVLGFARLAQIRIPEAMMAFAIAVEQDPTSSLAFLGQGLARIRDGNLEEGRRDLETAATLDPNSALVHSYLGKAYFEEKRDADAAWELELAKQLDPDDPTAFLYDAIRKQTTNRPVAALRDLQESIANNDNRAVYRSRLLLDEDLGARGASLGRIYQDLGFEQLALVEGTQSLATDPSNYSAHRFLSDSYASRPRHEIARASELLRSQLLQPININPIQPSLGETDLNIVSGSGPAETTFNEFTPLFERDQLRFTGSGLIGSWADEAVVSGIEGPLSFSLGQFHFEDDGFRENNDLEHDIYNLFTQVQLTPGLNIQGEYRRRETEQGDLSQNFDPDNFSTSLRTNLTRDTARFGVTLQSSPSSHFLGSFIYSEGTRRLMDVVLEVDSDTHGYDTQAQYMFSSDSFSVTAGGGVYDIDEERITRLDYTEIYGVPCPDLFPTCETLVESTIQEHNAYVYAYWNMNRNVTATFGISHDSFEEGPLDQDGFYPKLGLVWRFLPATRLRLAYTKGLTRTLLVDQTLEPTEVAGFNQFFDDISGTEAERYGVGIDAELVRSVYGGIDLSRRDLVVPVRQSGFAEEFVQFENRREHVYSAYVYWALGADADYALTAEYQLEKFRNRAPLGFPAQTGLETTSVPVAVRYFHPLGMFAEFSTTYVRQDVRRLDLFGIAGTDRDDFTLLDAAVGYRLPNRRGIVSLQVKNLLDSEFRFEEVNFHTQEPGNPRFLPARTIRVVATITF